MYVYFYLILFKYFFFLAGKYIEESDVIVDIKDQDLGILFADGTSPPRIQKLDLLSCFTGSLMVGDLILQVDKKVSSRIE